MKRLVSRGLPVMIVVCCLAAIGLWAAQPQPKVVQISDDLKVIAWNDLGMHCMNQDFSEFMILPCYNTLHAQVIDRRGKMPRIIESGVQIQYRIPGNTHSSDKTNFWVYVEDLLGKKLAPDVGLTGNRLSGQMSPTGKGDWIVTGIPLTPRMDSGKINTFQLAQVTVNRNRRAAAETSPVTPVSWELRCDFCHHGAPDAPISVLEAHDLLHQTNLYDPATGGPAGGTPVLCGGCHAQPELGIPDNHDGAVSSLSHAMHNAHASRMMDVVDSVPNGNTCYACHPGPNTQCLRDLHARRQMVCADCHAGGTKDSEMAMLAVADPARTPWVTEPRCDDCHHHPGYEYEQAGTLFRDSRGHGGIYCEACHNSTHALTPARDYNDNVQSIMLQGRAGTIQDCTVCHAAKPRAKFQHLWAASLNP
jgi:hypothetical protein